MLNQSPSGLAILMRNRSDWRTPKCRFPINANANARMKLLVRMARKQKMKPIIQIYKPFCWKRWKNKPSAREEVNDETEKTRLRSLLFAFSLRLSLVLLISAILPRKRKGWNGGSACRHNTFIGIPPPPPPPPSRYLFFLFWRDNSLRSRRVEQLWCKTQVKRFALLFLK